MIEQISRCLPVKLLNQYNFISIFFKCLSRILRVEGCQFMNIELPYDLCYVNRHLNQVQLHVVTDSFWIALLKGLELILNWFHC